MRHLLIALCFLLLAACSGNGGKQDNHNSPESEPVVGRAGELQLADHLNIPWSITKRDGLFYISERNGTIVTIEEQSGKSNRLPVKLNKKLHTGGEGGFLGIELIPGTDNEAFAYHTYEDKGQVLNRVIRIQKEDDAWIETAIILEGIPGAQIHNGGRIKIGPDGKLYITAGDAANPESAQSLNSLSGKILRLELDGTVPSNNPFAGSPIYSFGHRNPQGLAWDEHGQLYATEHGASAHDEINKIERGKNYGWPEIQGNEKKDGMVTPIYHTNGNTWAPSGSAYHNGKLYIATLRGEAVRVYDITSGTATIFVNGNGRIRDVLIVGDDLYFVTNNTDGRGTPSEIDDRLLKIKVK